ncbi:MAG: DinB family protein [Bacillota bacterium]
MRYDLVPDPAMAPTVGLLHAMLEDAHGRLRELVGDMAQEEYDYKGPSGQLNSASQLVRHLVYVDIRWLYRIRGESIPPAVEARFGPFRDEQGRLPASRGRSPAEMLAEYGEVKEQLRAACRGLTDGDLDRRYIVSNGAEVTLRWGLWHLGDHNLFHQGQITWLKSWARGRLAP